MLSSLGLRAESETATRRRLLWEGFQPRWIASVSGLKPLHNGYCCRDDDSCDSPDMPSTPVARIPGRCGSGAPLGIGKPHGCDARYGSIERDPSRSLQLYTALFVDPASGSSDLGNDPRAVRVATPSATTSRVSPTSRRRNAIHAGQHHVEDHLQSGALLQSRQAQRRYASLNYTHVAPRAPPIACKRHRAEGGDELRRHAGIAVVENRCHFRRDRGIVARAAAATAGCGDRSAPSVAGRHSRGRCELLRSHRCTAAAISAVVRIAAAAGGRCRLRDRLLRKRLGARWRHAADRHRALADARAMRWRCATRQRAYRRVLDALVRNLLNTPAVSPAAARSVRAKACTAAAR